MLTKHKTVRTLTLPNYGVKKTLLFHNRFKGETLRSGSFAAVDSVLWNGAWQASNFQFCREYFQDKSSGLRRMVFVHKSHKSKHIASFIGKIEKKVKVKSGSFFGPTQRNNIMWMMPSRWWMDTEMKRSLFTCLLRCGWEYDPLKDNFEEALWSQRYLRQTKYAVQRFLGGYTRYMGQPIACYDDEVSERVGWYDEFFWGRKGMLDGSPRTHKEINRLLRKPNLNDFV